METKAKLVGAEPYPPGYNWGPSVSKGGMGFNLWDVWMSMYLCWATNDPTTTADDTVSLVDEYGNTLISVPYNLGGHPDGSS